VNARVSIVLSFVVMIVVRNGKEGLSECVLNHNGVLTMGMSGRTKHAHSEDDGWSFGQTSR